MAFTFATHMARVVKGKILGNPSWIHLLNQTAQIPGGATSGPITVDVLADATVSGIVSGTMCTDGTDNTSVTATVVNGQVTFDILPSNRNAVATQPAYQAQLAAKVADAFIRDMETKMIAAFVAATPTDTNTLTAGQLDFSDDGTDEEARDNIANLDKVIATIRGNNGGTTRGMYILMAPAAYGNWLTSYGVVRGNAAPRGDGLADHRGIPVFPVGSTSTNWGGASKECMFICAPDAGLLTTSMPYLHGGGILAASDGTHKMIWVCPYMYSGAVSADHLGAIISDAT